MSLVLGLERGVKGDALGRPAFRRLPLTPSEAPKNGKEGCGTVVLQPSDCKFSFSRRPSGATARGTGREGRNTIGGRRCLKGVATTTSPLWCSVFQYFCNVRKMALECGFEGCSFTGTGFRGFRPCSSKLTAPKGPKWSPRRGRPIPFNALKAEPPGGGDLLYRTKHTKNPSRVLMTRPGM